MGRTCWLLAAAALAVVGAGCSNGFSDPLVGTWATAFTVGTITGTSTYQVNGDGTLAYNLSGASASCSGAMTWTGYTWAVSGTIVTFAGTPVCSGGVTCGGLTYDCSSGNKSALQAGSCTFTLSNNDDTLALTNCTGTSNATLTREN